MIVEDKKEIKHFSKLLISKKQKSTQWTITLFYKMNMEQR